MQTQTPEEAKRFLVLFLSICGIVASLIAAGLLYIKYAIVSTYFPTNPKLAASATLILLLVLIIWLGNCGLHGPMVTIRADVAKPLAESIGICVKNGR